ncbi:MAG: 16S rRNA (cytosine(967)-C(5))-methyltransferase RsmB [Betaproteobacteria bacterium]|nr:16S rRNA (cytosine(967)-C(5))-methyltransferase RsmB [Betaproteobacteria bacterium]
MQEIQRLAGSVVGRVLAGNSLDAELAALWRGQRTLVAQQRAAIQDLCFGTLRFLGQVDALLDALLDKPLRDERLRCLLRVALYQLEHTRAAPHAIVDHAVRAAGRIGVGAAKGLINAVLRNFLRERARFLAQARRSDEGRFSYPAWWIAKLRRQYPEQFAAILDAGNLHPPLTLRVNRRRATPREYVDRLTAAGIAARGIGGSAILLDRPRPVETIPGFVEGLVSIQDAAAQRAAPLLDLAPRLRVLDACAAPGGKTAHMLELADVEVTALDSDARRLERVWENLTRLNLSARVVCGDAGEPAGWWDGRPFDRVLADVPCSASGVVRRHPDIKWLRRPGDIAQFARAQQRMLDALWQLLATGGKFLYATCSVFHEENHLQVEQFLERHRNAHRLILPGAGNHHAQPAGQMLPDREHDGFFYALLQKK